MALLEKYSKPKEQRRFKYMTPNKWTNMNLIAQRDREKKRTHTDTHIPKSGLFKLEYI